MASSDPQKLQQSVDQFLACRRIAVAGVSRTSAEAANFIYRKLRDCGHEVFAVNPNAQEVEGDRCYPDLAAIPGGVEAVVIATHPRVSAQIVHECHELQISHVWLHRSFGTGSVSDEAVRLCREKGLSVIPGACPMMFCTPVDFGHKCIRWILKLTGGLPQTGAAD